MWQRVKRAGWSSGRLALLLILVACSQPALADRPPPIHPTLAQQLRFLEIRLVGGRIWVTSLDATRSIDSTASSGDRQERLLLSFHRGLVTLSYQMSTPAGQWNITATDGDEMIIRRTPKSPSTEPSLEFIQPAGGMLTLRLGDGPVHSGVSFWHLMLGHPKLCDDELVPILQWLKPQWPLVPTAQGIEKALHTGLGSSRRYDRRTVAELLRDLGSDQYTRREAADRQLRESGQPIMPLLRGIDRQRLDAEQAFRVRNILRSMSGDPREDSAERVALWLAGDPTIWLALLERDDPSVQRWAAQELSRLLEKPVKFDPDADAAARARQRAAIALEIERAVDF
jgi:hypothetical protein